MKYHTLVNYILDAESLPTRECGLKSWDLTMAQSQHSHVTPYAGVWIEIGIRQYVKMTVDVTPYAGVWIEID